MNPTQEEQLQCGYAPLDSHEPGCPFFIFALRLLMFPAEDLRRDDPQLLGQAIG